MDERPALMPEPGDSIYFRDGSLFVLDQTLLPLETAYLRLQTPAQVAEAIRGLSVRGAPAIGIAGAYGALLGAVRAARDVRAVRSSVDEAIEMLASSRPTARNLFWALERMKSALDDGPDEPEALVRALREAADGVALEVIETDLALVRAGQEVVFEGARILTHCNSGPLAALRYGTGVGIFIYAHKAGKSVHVYVDETRPLLQGSRLTAWELEGQGVPYTLICDNMAAQVMKQGEVDMVITGADRIAANGDCANKIGTYSLAVLACAHGIPFYIAAPGSTVDLDCPEGSGIVVEQRDPEEVRCFGGRRTAPSGAPVFNPAFDVTPASLITAIITDAGVLRAPYSESLAAFRARPRPV